MTKLLRLALLPIGLLKKIKELAISGSRDIYNSLTFDKAIIDSGCIINNRSTVGNDCHILNNCIILNSTVNPYTYIGKNSQVQNSFIGSFCSIANDVIIGTGSHPTNLFSTSPLMYHCKNTFNMSLVDSDHQFDEYKPIIIGNDVWIGARAIILDGVNVSDGAIIGAGAVVTKNVPPYAIVAGVPARIIKYRFPPDKIESFLVLKWWSWPISKIKERINELKSMNNENNRNYI